MSATASPRSLVERFRRDEGGNVLVLFGLASIPLLGFAGGVIDYSAASQQRLNLQVALDAATLATAKEPPLTDADALKAKVRARMAPRLAAAGLKDDDWEVTSATDQNGKVHVAAKLNVTTSFLGVMGQPNWTVASASEVSRAQNKLEVALVMDNTGSMESDGKIGALRTAANTLLTKLYEAPGSADKVKVSLVPFVTAVNIKAATGFNEAWIDKTAKATHHGTNFSPKSDGTRVSHLDLFTDLGETWKGCVEARAAPYDTDDTAPTSTNAATLFVPWFWPDEPDPTYRKSGETKPIHYKYTPGNPSSYLGTNYGNNYLPDGFAAVTNDTPQTNAEARQLGWSKYKNQAASKSIVNGATADARGPNKSCPEALTPLTNAKDTMQTRINAMKPWHRSGTNVAQGMMWGWSVLSPTAPFTEGAPYADDQTPDDKTDKAMVVLTDGENELFGAPDYSDAADTQKSYTHNLSNYSSYGYLAKERLGTTSRSAGITAVNAKVTALCDKIKAKKIRLYTITFKLEGKTETQNLFRNCATKPENGEPLYYNSPSTSELEGIFKRIAEDLNDLHFSQ